MASSKWIKTFMEFDSKRWMEQHPLGIRGTVIGPKRLPYARWITSSACVIREEESGAIVQVLLDGPLQSLFAEGQVNEGDRLEIQRTDSRAFVNVIQPNGFASLNHFPVRASLLEVLLSDF